MFFQSQSFLKINFYYMLKKIYIYRYAAVVAVGTRQAKSNNLHGSNKSKKNKQASAEAFIDHSRGLYAVTVFYNNFYFINNFT